MYNYVNTQYKFIIFWSPKCACSSIQNIVAQYVVDDANFYKIMANINNRIPEFQKDYLIIVVARDPFNRLVSGFLDKYAFPINNGDKKMSVLEIKKVTIRKPRIRKLKGDAKEKIKNNENNEDGEEKHLNKNNEDDEQEDGKQKHLNDFRTLSVISNFEEFVLFHGKIKRDYIYNSHILAQFKGKNTELINNIGRIDHLFLVDRKGDLDMFNKVIAKRIGKNLLPMPWIKKTEKSKKIISEYYLTEIKNIREPIPDYQSFKSKEIEEQIRTDFDTDYQWIEKLKEWSTIAQNNSIDDVIDSTNT